MLNITNSEEHMTITDSNMEKAYTKQRWRFKFPGHATQSISSEAGSDSDNDTKIIKELDSLHCNWRINILK